MKKRFFIALGLLMLIVASTAIAQATTRKTRTCSRCGKTYAVGTTHHCSNPAGSGRHDNRR